jgi:hypothetical protein
MSGPGSGVGVFKTVKLKKNISRTLGF